jgi:orotate phosphoribosyltransferase
VAQPPIHHFRETGAILDGHFVLSSGLHSGRYLQCALVLQYPERAEALCREIRAAWTEDHPDIVVGPAMGGITLAYELGRSFGVPAIFAEREGGAFALRRGFHLAPGQRVLIAEDVVTTGGSVREVEALVRSLGAHVAGVACLVHRSPENPFDVPLVSVLEIEVESWAAGDCPLCKQGLPAVKPGSRPGGKTAKPETKAC